jgi:hypothetical protein
LWGSKLIYHFDNFPFDNDRRKLRRDNGQPLSRRFMAAGRGTHFSDIWIDAQRARSNAKIIRNFFLGALLAGARGVLARRFEQFFKKCDAGRTPPDLADASSGTFQSSISKFEQ